MPSEDILTGFSPYGFKDASFINGCFLTLAGVPDYSKSIPEPWKSDNYTMYPVNKSCAVSATVPGKQIRKDCFHGIHISLNSPIPPPCLIPFQNGKIHTESLLLGEDVLNLSFCVKNNGN